MKRYLSSFFFKVHLELAKSPLGVGEVHLELRENVAFCNTFPLGVDGSPLGLWEKLHLDFQSPLGVATKIPAICQVSSNGKKYR